MAEFKISLASYSFHGMLAAGVRDVFGYLDALKYRHHLEWADIIHDLGKLLETEISVKEKGYIIRSESQGVAGKVAQACGVALPPVLRPFKAKQ